MSQKNATELCTVLLKEIYGDVSAKVVSVLLEYGRLNLSTLVRYSRLSEKIVKQTLVVLIQLHLVAHYTHRENHRQEVYYECAWAQVYELVHAGRMIATAEERFGPAGGFTISNMLQMGHVRVSDFLAGSGLPKTAKEKPVKGGQPSTNGATNGDVDTSTSGLSTVGELKSAMGELLKNRFLIPVQEHHMHPYTDVVNDVRQKLSKELRAGTTSELKLKKLVDAEMKTKLRTMAIGDNSEHAGMKRRGAPDDVRRPGKRQKVSTHDTFYDKEPEYEIDESIIVRVNHEKFLILFRNQELVTLAERRIGKVTAQVYGELLKAMENKTFKCQDDEDEEADGSFKKLKVSTLELSRNFPGEIEVENSFGVIPKTAVANGKKRPLELDEDDVELNGNGKARKANGITNGHNGIKADDDEDMDDGDDDEEEEDEWAADEEDINPETAFKKKRMGFLKEHLELLAQDSYHFVKPEGTRGLGEWSVPFSSLSKIMKQIEMEKVIEQRFGPVATRLVRILHEKGKLDEKQLATIALRKSTSIRSTLSALQEAGHLELQEVPKTNERAASRTIFLWYYDPARARSNTLHDLYKAMSRTLQRIGHERDEVKALLEKAERTDIQGKEEIYLSKAEQRTIARFRVMEEKLLGQLFRLDRQVMIFRDL